MPRRAPRARRLPDAWTGRLVGKRLGGRPARLQDVLLVARDAVHGPGADCGAGPAVGDGRRPRACHALVQPEQRVRIARQVRGRRLAQVPQRQRGRGARLAVAQRCAPGTGGRALSAPCGLRTPRRARRTGRRWRERQDNVVCGEPLRQLGQPRAGRWRNVSQAAAHCAAAEGAPWAPARRAHRRSAAAAARTGARRRRPRAARAPATPRTPPQSSRTCSAASARRVGRAGRRTGAAAARCPPAAPSCAAAAAAVSARASGACPRAAPRTTPLPLYCCPLPLVIRRMRSEGPPRRGPGTCGWRARSTRTPPRCASRRRRRPRRPAAAPAAAPACAPRPGCLPRGARRRGCRQGAEGSAVQARQAAGLLELRCCCVRCGRATLLRFERWHGAADWVTTSA
jgi:hypothetical protein